MVGLHHRVGRMRLLLFSGVVSLVSFSSLYPQVAAPRTFLLNPKIISKVRDAIRVGDKRYEKALKLLRREGDKALKQKPVSVMDKAHTPPSGDKHDYMSLAPYWWPDPKQPDGLPYIRRDGEVNPERKDFTDRDYLIRLASCVHTLALAYYYTRNELYAAHASTMLRTWFLHPETRMNPNLNYGQAVRGHNEGRGAGLIETSRFRYVIDAIGLLELSNSWTEADRLEIRKWFGEYFKWLRTSEVGIDESNAKNNHGTWYDVQSVSIALFLGDTTAAKSILQEAKTKRIAVQIEPDGRMPLELARTKALHYSTMNLEGLFYLATLAERAGIDLWQFATDDARSIKRALDWLLPFYSGEQRWEYKQIVSFDYEYVYGLLTRAATYYQDARYASIAQKLPSAKEDGQRALLMYGPTMLQGKN
jgi:hypothetical protein